MNQNVKIFVIDAFTDEIFSGNPAAVCCLEKDLSDDLKKKIAAEMNLSETAFVTLNDEIDGSFEVDTSFGLRWFTPTHEVDLCGHATLASASAIFHKYGNKAPAIEFKTRSGILRAYQKSQSSITLDFPINPPLPYEASNLQDIVQAASGNNEIEIQEILHSPATKKLVLRLADKYRRQDIENMAPFIQEFLSVENSGMIKGVIVTLKADNEKEGYDFYSRYFAPWVGILEDPVTGSAHTVLAPYWQKVLNKNEFRARQCSKRGGDLTVKIVEQRVELTGQVAFVLEGTIRYQ